MTIEYYNTIKCTCKLISAFASLLLIFKFGYLWAKGSQKPSTKLLFFVGLCDFVFSLTGGTLNAFGLVYGHEFDDEWWQIVALRAPHYSFEVASFLWILTLSIYIGSAHKTSFKISIFHLCNWSFFVVFFLLEIMAISKPKVKWLNLTVRLLWDLSAIIMLIGVFRALIKMSRSNRFVHYNSTLSIRFKLYLIAVLVLVSPNIVKDTIYIFDVKYDNLKRVCALMFALLPLANGLVFNLHSTYISCCHGNRNIGSFTEEGSQDFHGEELVEICRKQQLKGLKIGEKIGESGAVVYKGIYRGTLVAVKQQKLLPLDDHIEEFESACNEEIQQEVAILQGLRHGNVVLFMEAGFHNNMLCIISEFCPNGSLRDVIKSPTNEGISWPMKLRLALGIAKGLSYLHTFSPPMIHRDLKGPNILVDETWHAKVADFGTSRFTEIVHKFDQRVREAPQNILMTGLIGTTRWMAPEMILHEQLYDEKIDIYSFGIILWELIEGGVPFDNIRWNHLIESMIVEGDRPSIPYDCPSRWKDLMISCWDADPCKRPSSSTIINTLSSIMQNEMVINKNGKLLKLSDDFNNYDCNFILHDLMWDYRIDDALVESSHCEANCAKVLELDVGDNATSICDGYLYSTNCIGKRSILEDVDPESLSISSISTPSQSCSSYVAL